MMCLIFNNDVFLFYDDAFDLKALFSTPFSNRSPIISK